MAGQLTPIIGRTFPLGEAADAMRYMEDGRVVGRIIITP
ncbi:MAG: zinc-binding dehydrogenase [Acidobacteriia bacterium]|nr:zinc-binding dehydrogenase [Terriglobia bacterium]